MLSISDRGVNFDYLPPKRKRRMLQFFGWFGDRLPPVPERISGDAALRDTILPGSSTAGTIAAPDDSTEMPAGIGLGPDAVKEPPRS